MRILALADFHSSRNALDRLHTLLKTEKFDIAVIAGDFTVPGAAAVGYLNSVSNILKNVSLPWISVHGNNDPEEVVKLLRESHHNLHYEPQEFGGYRFVGIGGWGDEPPAYDLKPHNSILVTHVPPYLRSRPLPENLIDAPLLHIAGHIHWWAKVTDVGETRVINLPAAIMGRAAIITLPERKVQFITLPKTAHF